MSVGGTGGTGNAGAFGHFGADGGPDAAGRASGGTPALGAAAAAPIGTPGAAPQPRDAALAKAFPRGFQADVRSGARGDPVLAVQYALGRLGHLESLADGSFGPKTAAAVSSFQRGAGLPQTGVVDRGTFAALDAAAAAHDPRPPAARAASPLAYFSDWSAFPVSQIAVSDRSRPIAGAHPEIQEAYGKFVSEYWSVLKTNRVEADCKTLALFFMDQFRSKVKADTGAELPLPSSAGNRIPRASWTAATSARPAGFFSRFEQLPSVRPGYGPAQAIQKLDPRQSMVHGVNLRYAGIDANGVARAATTRLAWDPRAENRGDQARPEVPVNELKSGDIVFIDHTGDKKWDHTVNVVGVERDAAGRARKLTLAGGSFDDMKDADGATSPRGLQEVNNYAEEVVVDLDEAGKIAGSRVTWSSEPSYLVAGRYSARTTIMELKPGGTLKVARWG